MRTSLLRTPSKIIRFLLCLTAKAVAAFVLLNAFGALVRANGGPGWDWDEEEALTMISASQFSRPILNNDNLTVANASAILFIPILFRILSVRRQCPVVNKGINCSIPLSKGKKSLLRIVNLRRKRTLGKLNSKKRSRHNGIDDEKGSSSTSLLDLEPCTTLKVTSTPTKNSGCGDSQLVAGLCKPKLESTEHLFYEIKKLKEIAKDKLTIAAEENKKEVVETVQEAKPDSLKEALNRLKAQRNEFKDLQNEFNAITFATNNARQGANYWAEAVNEVDQAKRATERAQYTQHMRLVQRYKESIVECTKKAMSLRDQMQRSNKYSTKNIQCYDCHIGRHSPQPSVKSKNDVINFLSTCPIVQEINARYVALNLDEYVAADVKLERISKLQKELQRALFRKTYLRDGCFRI